MKKSPSILMLTLLLGGLSIILAIAVFSVNAVTYPIVEATAEQEKSDAFIEIVPEASEFIDVTDKAGDDSAILEVYEATDGSDVIAYIYLVSTVGYADDIENIVAIDTATNTIKSIKILKQTETPGLGAKSSEPAFQEQFSGLEVGEVSVVKGGADAASNEIDAITASTITSTAVTKGVNIALDDYQANFGK